jgi:hypothetical protein
VVRNSGELMWRGATRSAGTCRSRCSPVATDGWDAASLDEHIHESAGSTWRRWPARPHRHRQGDGHHDDGRLRPAPALPLDWGASPDEPAGNGHVARRIGGPRPRVTVSLLELLDPAPDWDRLLAAHEWASAWCRGWAARAEPALALGTPAG